MLQRISILITKMFLCCQFLLAEIGSNCTLVFSYERDSTITNVCSSVHLSSKPAPFILHPTNMKYEVCLNWNGKYLVFQEKFMI